MNMDVDITPIMQAVIALVSAVITVFLIPYLKTKLTEAQRKRIKEYIDTAVMAAEKLFPSAGGEKLGEEKFEMAIQNGTFIMAEKQRFELLFNQLDKPNFSHLTAY